MLKALLNSHSLTFLIPWFFLPLLMSSAPFAPIKYKKGIPLKLEFKKDHGIKAIGWKGLKLHFISDEALTFELKREALGKLPENLILFPSDAKNKPKEFVVKESEEIFVDMPQWKRVKPNEIIIWGETPVDVCHFTSQPHKSLSSFSIILFPKPKVLGARGSFHLTIEKKSFPQFFHGFTSHGKVGQFDAPPLNPPTEKQMNKCSRYHGGICDFLFQIPDEAYGRSIHLPIPSIKKSSAPCPV